MEKQRIILPRSDEELLRQCHVSAFRASGAGGQHVNVTDSAVRLRHLPTGIVVTSQKERSQLLNKRECVRKLRALVKKLNYRAPKRVPTKMPSSVKRENLERKTRHGKTKRLRGRPTLDE
jgi:protein subunit release factor B